MAYISFNSGFKVGSHSAIDARILLSKAEMRRAEELYAMPDKYFAVCKDDGQIYLFDTENEFDDLTGRFRILKTTATEKNSVIFGNKLNDKFYTDSTYTTELPINEEQVYFDANSSQFFRPEGDTFVSIEVNPVLATDTVPGVMKLYQNAGYNTDGTMSQKAISEIKFDVEVIDADGNPDTTDDQENCLVLSLPF